MGKPRIVASRFTKNRLTETLMHARLHFSALQKTTLAYEPEMGNR